MMHRRGSVGIANNLGLRLCIGNKTRLQSFVDLAGCHASDWDPQRAFSTTRLPEATPGPAAPAAKVELKPRGCETHSDCSGHPKLPWEPYVELLGRDAVLQRVRETVQLELAETGPARSRWHVAYAAGRAGSGKTELGKQLPRILASDKESPDWAFLSNSAYLLVECNGGGDGFAEEDFPLKPEYRLGWRLLAAVCRDSINLNGLKELRRTLLKTGSEVVCGELKESGFPNVAGLLKETRRGGNAEDLGYPITARDVLGALAKDLRHDPDSNERVAIIVHVDEHQLMWGKGLPANRADEEARLDTHKAFLYDLCTLRGDGRTTWCRENNIFMFPIFTGTASAILAPLLNPTYFRKLHLQFEPLTAVEARMLFQRELIPNPTWTDPNTSGGTPMDFVLSELGRIPRLLLDSAKAPRVREIFSQKCDYDLIHQAFDAVQALFGSPGVTEQMARLVVAGVEVGSQTKVDGRTIEQHEFDGFIVRHHRPGRPADAAAKFAIRVPATEYRVSVARAEGLEAISAFANLEYSCRGWNGRGERCTPWSELFERMMMERFQNLLQVYLEILNRTKPIAIEELYPYCVIWPNPAVKPAFQLPSTVEKLGQLSLCHDDNRQKRFVYDRKAWLTALELLTEGSCHSRLLTKDHPAFDVVHLHREGKVVRCFLEQLKNRDSPTRDIFPPKTNESQEFIEKITNSVPEVLKKFHPVMVQMTETAKKLGLELHFVPVYCDRRMPTDDDARFWLDHWIGKAGSDDLTIAAAVAGSQRAMPGLFPCLEHRFVLLEEQSLKPSSDKRSEQNNKCST